MSKKMTPCERLGYKVGDEFEVISHHAFKKGQVVTLHEDDGTECPLFAGDGGGAGVFDGVECSFATLNKQVRKIANKLKPAKQALADAIHQNGGWKAGYFAVYGKISGVCSFCDSKPIFDRLSHGWWVSSCGDEYEFKMKPFINWHQCILSRDEYFTAYPEQVKVEINNETKHKVDVEMKSESEMTINASDWHKNGELPPVGVFVDVAGDGLFYGQGESSCEVIAHVENTAVIRMSYGLGCFESGAIIPARTERDKAIDEMVDVITDGRDSPLYVIKIATRLYEAGYRKEVK